MALEILLTSLFTQSDSAVYNKRNQAVCVSAPIAMTKTGKLLPLVSQPLWYTVENVGFLLPIQAKIGMLICSMSAF